MSINLLGKYYIYTGMVFAFSMAHPASLPYACFLIFSFIGPISSFLAYAILAAKKKMHTTTRGVKSFYHLGGICEGTETAFILMLICAVPVTFEWVCIIYGILCWLTTAGRVYRAWIDFGKGEATSLDVFEKECTVREVTSKPQARQGRR